MKATLSRLVLAAALVAAGCSDSTTANPSGGSGGSSGGATGTGGSASGGTIAAGGAGSGGAIGSGGAASGGVTGTGGSGSGGRTASGGSNATGGSTATGGSGTAGKTGSGGSTAAGGATGGAGGTTAAAGSSGSGGLATGGGSGRGGSAGTGPTATGGGGGRGGAAGTAGSTVTAGGTTGAGGSTSTVIGATPPMGWNSWNKFGCNGLTESVVKKMADAFVSTGMKDAGYEYVNLDDCWMDGRDSSGKLKPSASKFPSGIASLADYVHNKGLKLGIYSTPNTQTCAGLYGGYTGGVGSKDHETTDAQSFADWGVDYLKYDKCKGDMSRFAVMRDALKKAGRPIFYSINPADQGPYCTPSSCSIDLVSIANMWRIEFDISANWDSVIRLIDKDKPEYAGAGPGHWNDPDMLEVGNGLNDTEGRAHFSMWAIMAAPLITGNDLSTMSATTKEILTNKEIIAVNQDPLGKQARAVVTSGSTEVWSKDMSGTNTRAVALFNRGTGSASITVQWSKIGLPAGAATVRDLWAAKDLGSFTDSYTGSSIASHSVMMLKIVSAP
jgi:alpha-galactosidase